jgi:hypothetical protein
MYKSIAAFPCPSSSPSLPASTLLAILGLASVCIYVAFGHPSRNFPFLFSKGFLCFGDLEISTPNTPVQSWVSSFSSLAWTNRDLAGAV